jgi:hypothetical protein
MPCAVELQAFEPFDVAAVVLADDLAIVSECPQVAASHIEFAHSLDPAVYVLHNPRLPPHRGRPGLPDLLLLGEYPAGVA